MGVEEDRGGGWWGVGWEMVMGLEFGIRAEGGCWGGFPVKGVLRGLCSPTKHKTRATWLRIGYDINHFFPAAARVGSSSGVG